jgi:hypothetical protein
MTMSPCWRSRAHGRFLAGAIVAVLVTSALYPFRLDLPRRVENGVRRRSDGGLTVHSPGLARIDLPAEWLEEVDQGAPLRIELMVRADSSHQSGPARILSIGATPHAANLVIAQSDHQLVVRVRRPTSGPDGRPAVTVPDVFTDPEWHSILVDLRENRLAVQVDARDETSLPYEVPLGWDASFDLTLANEASGHRPWLGSLRAARLRVGIEEIDLLSPRRLFVPSSWTEYPLRWHERGGFHRLEAAAVAAKSVVFGALALVLAADGGRSRRRALLLPIALAGALQIAKYGIAGRHPSVVDVLAAAGGAAFGLLVATRWTSSASGQAS